LVENRQVIAVVRGIPLAASLVSPPRQLGVRSAQQFHNRGFVVGVGLEQQIFQDDHRRGVVLGLDQSPRLGDRSRRVDPCRGREAKPGDEDRNPHYCGRDSLTHDDPCPAWLEIGPALETGVCS
jgi:hypothetical protein